MSGRWRALPHGDGDARTRTSRALLEVEEEVEAAEPLDRRTHAPGDSGLGGTPEVPGAGSALGAPRARLRAPRRVVDDAVDNAVIRLDARIHEGIHK